MELVLSFFKWLYSFKLRHGGGDCLGWSRSKRGQFEGKLFYKVLTSQDNPKFPWKSIWQVKAPSRVAFFVRIAAFGEILTHDNLRKRNVVMVEWCCMCKKSGQSIDHLLLHCDIVGEL
jgi:hypothetical protein